MKVLQERPKGRWCVLERWWLMWREGDSATCKTVVKCKEKERQLGSEALEPQTYNYNQGVIQGQNQKGVNSFTDEKTQIWKG